MVISRLIIRVTPFRALITLLITYLLSPLPLQVGLGTSGFRGSWGLEVWRFCFKAWGREGCKALVRELAGLRLGG